MRYARPFGCCFFFGKLIYSTLRFFTQRNMTQEQKDSRLAAGEQAAAKDARKAVKVSKTAAKATKDAKRAARAAAPAAADEPHPRASTQVSTRFVPTLTRSRICYWAPAPRLSPLTPRFEPVASPPSTLPNA